MSEIKVCETCGFSMKGDKCLACWVNTLTPDQVKQVREILDKIPPKFNAYTQGHVAFERGISLDANPYPSDSGDYGEWLQGWRAAENEEQD